MTLLSVPEEEKMPRIFLVEDNESDVDLFRMALDEARLNCDLVVFGDGEAIIEYVLSLDSTPTLSVPDLVVLDLNLPKKDGAEVIQIIRKSKSLGKVSVAVLSSSSSPRERARISAFQVSEFIVKPPDLEGYLRIGKTVGKLLERVKAIELS